MASGVVGCTPKYVYPLTPHTFVTLVEPVRNARVAVIDRDTGKRVVVTHDLEAGFAGEVP